MTRTSLNEPDPLASNPAQPLPPQVFIISRLFGIIELVISDFWERDEQNVKFPGDFHRPVSSNTWTPVH